MLLEGSSSNGPGVCPVARFFWGRGPVCWARRGLVQAGGRCGGLVMDGREWKVCEAGTPNRDDVSLTLVLIRPSWDQRFKPRYPLTPFIPPPHTFLSLEKYSSPPPPAPTSTLTSPPPPPPSDSRTNGRATEKGATGEARENFARTDCPSRQRPVR